MIEAHGWTVRELDAAHDADAVAAVAVATADYYLLVNGTPPRADHGRDFFGALAPGKRREDMLKLGIETPGGSLVGVLDAARSFPAAGSWYIGLLLVRPDARGRGAGRAAVECVADRASAAGAGRLLLSVVEENAIALRFWQRLGFAQTRTLEPQQFGSKTHVLVELERTLHAA